MMKYVLSTLLLCSGLLAGPAAANSSVVRVASNLHADAQLAQRKGKPVLIIFTRPDCVYCERVIDYYLIPMQRNPDYAGKVLIRQMDMTSSKPLSDFRGHATTEKQYAARLKINFAPTIVVFTPDGEPASKPLVGLGSKDYYGGYMDQAINAGLAGMLASPL
jgi:thioredoxin-related protein